MPQDEETDGPQLAPRDVHRGLVWRPETGLRRVVPLQAAAPAIGSRIDVCYCSVGQERDRPANVFRAAERREVGEVRERLA